MSAGLSRGWRIVLIASLGLNLLIAGGVAGHLLRSDDARSPRKVDLSIGPFTRALSEDDRRAVGADLRGRLRSGGHDPRLTRRARGDDLRQFVTLLEEDPFRAAEFAQALRAERDRMAKVASAAETALIERIAAMSPEERRAFAARLQAEFRDREKIRRRPRD